MPQIVINAAETVNMGIGGTSKHARVYTFRPADLPQASLDVLFAYGKRKLNDMINSTFATLRSDETATDADYVKAMAAILTDFEAGTLGSAARGPRSAVDDTMKEYETIAFAWLATMGRKASLVRADKKKLRDDGMSATDAVNCVVESNVRSIIASKYVVKVIKTRGEPYSVKEAVEEFGDAIDAKSASILAGFLAKADEVIAARTADSDDDLDINID